jgi:hypothetical protein
MFKVDKIEFNNDGKTILYRYHHISSIAKYFNKKNPFYLNYDQDISQVHESINIIPLLSNIMPISWFVGFDVYVNELDQTYYESLELLKEEFSIHFPKIKLNSKLHFNKLVRNDFEKEETALLFSGGLDAFESLTRNLSTNPYLVSVLGADIEINDTKRWNDFKRFNNEESIINKNKLCYVTANLQTFYTHEVDLLINIGWWGKIQHGMSLISLIAPLSAIYGIKTILIASSNTGEISFGWGSTSETDEKVKWANQKTIHDGFHLRRTEKIENIVDFATKTKNYIKLRVCYSEWRDGYNCNRCPKCQRTMFGFILCGENPNNYGFNVPNDFYNLIFKNFADTITMSTGLSYEWRCLQDKARQSNNPFIVANYENEKKEIQKFIELKLNQIIATNLEEKNRIKKLKFIIKSKYPVLFKFYLKIRTKL